MHRFTIPSALVATTLALVGCGGSLDPAGPTAPSVAPLAGGGDVGVVAEQSVAAPSPGAGGTEAAAPASAESRSPVAAVARVDGAGGVTGPAFYVDGELYRTVGTPAILPQNAPDGSFDVIYDLSEYQGHNVATAAPGDPGFNGGRWRVHGVEFTDYASALATYDTNMSNDLDSAAEVEAAILGGAATDLGVVFSFECPVIPQARGHR